MPSPVTVSGGDVKAGPVSAPVIPLLLIGIGGYLAWFGIHYWRSDLKWPSDPVKAILQGKGLPATAQPAPEAAQLTALTSAYTGTEGAYQGSLPAGAAQNTAKLLLSKYGWGLDQMAALNTLWGTDESGWNSRARNPDSGAYGIAQALGHGGGGHRGAGRDQRVRRPVRADRGRGTASQRRIGPLADRMGPWVHR